MSFNKPKFWDSKKISFTSYLLLPITYLIKILYLIKKNFSKQNNFSVPVICVGNIYIGGTGKTPFCLELFDILTGLGKKPAFIRKKYDAYVDEFLLLSQKGKTFQDLKRSNAIKQAIKDNFQTVILDDGFQDYSIKKDLSIICFNEKQWIGNGKTIPSGPLRESLSSLKNAHLVIINGSKNSEIENTINEKNKSIEIFYTKYMPINISSYKDQKIIAFAGIGNPENFFNMLEQNELNILNKMSFPDHYNYSTNDIKNLVNEANKLSAILLTTEKDYLRINDANKHKINYIKIKLDVQHKDILIKKIKSII